MCERDVPSEGSKRYYLQQIVDILELAILESDVECSNDEQSLRCAHLYAMDRLVSTMKSKEQFYRDTMALKLRLYRDRILPHEDCDLPTCQGQICSDTGIFCRLAERHQRPLRDIRLELGVVLGRGLINDNGIPAIHLALSYGSVQELVQSALKDENALGEIDLINNNAIHLLAMQDDVINIQGILPDRTGETAEQNGHRGDGQQDDPDRAWSEQRNKYGRTPTCVTVGRGNLPTFGALFDTRTTARLKYHDVDQLDSLSFAATSSQPEMVNEIIRHLNDRGDGPSEPSLTSALGFAMKMRDVATTSLLVSHGAKPSDTMMAEYKESKGPFVPGLEEAHSQRVANDRAELGPALQQHTHTASDDTNASSDATTPKATVNPNDVTNMSSYARDGRIDGGHSPGDHQSGRPIQHGLHKTDQPRGLRSPFDPASNLPEFNPTAMSPSLDGPWCDAAGYQKRYDSNAGRWAQYGPHSYPTPHASSSDRQNRKS